MNTLQVIAVAFGIGLLVERTVALFTALKLLGPANKDDEAGGRVIERLDPFSAKTTANTSAAEPVVVSAPEKNFQGRP
ncbi:MAG TPA: hypothetical protein VIJ34_03610 [Acidimicrobiales bacterium]